MNTDFQQLAQLGGTVTTVFAFIWYLIKKDKSNKETYDRFSNMIENHLAHSNQIIKENSETNKYLAVILQGLIDIIKILKRKR